MAALFPTSVTTQLFQVQARAQTTLSADVDASTTTWNVVSTAGWAAQGFVVCENETVYYSAKTSTSLTVERALAGTAVSHTSGKAVKVAVVAETTNRIIQEIVATQSYLGISGVSAGTTTITYKLNNLYSFSQAGSTQVTNLNAQYLGGSTEGQLNAGYIGGSTVGQINTAIAVAGVNPVNLSGVSGVNILPNNIEITPSGWKLDNDNPATLLEITGTSVTPELNALYFGVTDQADFGHFKMPSEYNGGTVTLTYMYYGSTAGLTHNLGIKVAIAGSGVAYNPTFGTIVYLDTLYASGTTGVVKLYTTQIAGVSLGLTNNSLNFIRICGGTTNNVQLMNFGLSWSRG